MRDKTRKNDDFQLRLLFDQADTASKLKRTLPAGISKETRDLLGVIGILLLIAWLFRSKDKTKSHHRPPFNAEYVLYLLLRKEERDVVIGDLIEEYGRVLERFNKRRADIWFCKQVGGSLFPLLRRALLRIGALVWLGRILRRLIS